MISNLARAESTLAPPMPMRTIDGPAAWRGLDLKDAGAFTHRLTGDEIAEATDITSSRRNASPTRRD